MCKSHLQYSLFVKRDNRMIKEQFVMMKEQFNMQMMGYQSKIKNIQAFEQESFNTIKDIYILDSLEN